MTPVRYCPRCGKEIKEGSEEALHERCGNCGLDFAQRKERIKHLNYADDEKEELYADFFQRVAAFLIDSIVISCLTWVTISLIHIPIVISGPIVFYTSFYYFWIAMFFNWVLGFFYFWLMGIYNHGQSLGKRLLHLQTVNAETLQVADPDQYAITNILKTSPLLLIDFIMGFLISERDSNKVFRYLQHISKTVVIDLQH